MSEGTEKALNDAQSARWEAFREAVLALAEEHKLAGLLFSGCFVETDEQGRVTAIPLHASGNMPGLSSARALYSLRDQFLGGLRQIADQSIEQTLTAAEARAAAATEQAAEAAPAVDNTVQA